MKARFLILIVLLLAVLGVAAVDSYAATLTVTKTEDTNDGICDADCSLREAVFSARAGDTIVFSDVFTYTPQVIALSLGQIYINRDLSILGPGAELLDINASYLSRIFNISNGANVAIARLTISHGSQNGNNGGYRGGGIIVSSSSLTLTNVIFHHNFVFYPVPPSDYSAGGAVLGEQSTITVANCEFYSNRAAGGAGIGTTFGSTLQVTGSSFHDNTGNAISGESDVRISSSSFIANSGGGFGGSGTLSITDSLIEGNSGGPAISTGSSTDVLTIDRCIIRNNVNYRVQGFGGGITAGGMAIIRSSVISGNRATRAGGGICNFAHVIYIEDSSISGNFAGQEGGGIYNPESRLLYITNSTVSANQAPKGGGVHNETSPTSPPTYLFLTNSTVSFNTATAGAGGGILTVAPAIVETQNSVISGNTSTQGGPDVSGAVMSGGFNLIQNTVGSTGWTTTDLLGLDPMLAPLGSNGGNTFTHALLPGSPAINAGNNSLAVDPLRMLPLTTDQRGHERIGGGGQGVVDIGAYEAFYSLVPVKVSGRRGIFLTRLKLDDGNGNISYTQTNPFGYFRFLNLTPGTTYTVTITNKQYTFGPPTLFTADQNRDDLNFIALVPIIYSP